MRAFTRRETLALGALAGAAALVGPSFAFAKPEDARALVEKFTGGEKPAEGKITLDLPEIAENGNTVPLSVSVESPMTKDNYVKRVMILAEGNPRPEVVTLNFSPMSGAAEATTRMRLAKTQNIIAVAEMSDGSFSMAKQEVKVTIGGCGG